MIYEEILFWQARVIITQKPIPFVPPNELDPEDRFYQDPENIRTFLVDIFGDSVIDPTQYGLEIISSNRLQLIFFMKCESRDEAIERGYVWLSHLQDKFIGLDGIVKAKPIKKQEFLIQKTKKFSEIVLPSGIHRYKVNIIEKFINFFYKKVKPKVQLYLFWQREPQDNIRAEQADVYRMKIFISYDIDALNHDELSEIKGKIKNLYTDIENRKGERAKLIENITIDKLNLYDCNVFNEKDYDWKVYNKWNLNFDIPENIPFPQLPILKDENVRYIDVNRDHIKKSITVGKHIKNGVITKHNLFIPIDYLPENMIICGNPGTGKTTFLSNIIREIREKTEGVGILILNVAKEGQERWYNYDRIIRFYDNDFQLPYYMPGKYLRKSLQEMASYICASLGLKNVIERIIFRVATGFMEIKGNLPFFLSDFLKAVKNYINKHPYAKELQTNMLRAVENRIRTFEDPYLQNALKLSPELPSWIKEWLEGKTIFLDIKMCDKFSKQLIVNIIFHTIKTITKDYFEQKLRFLIIIDEAHEIFEKPDTRDPDDEEFIQKMQFGKIVSKYFREFRTRRVGIVIIDQTPIDLFDAAVTMPRIKVIFGLDPPHNKCFSEDPEERTIIRKLKKGLAIIISGPTGEKYLVKTKNISISQLTNEVFEIEKKQEEKSNGKEFSNLIDLISEIKKDDKE